MSAISKVLIILALWLLYTFLLFKGCYEELCVGCGAVAASAAVVPAPADDTLAAAVRRYAIDFQWANPNAFTNDGFPALKSNLFADKKEDNILEITGMYFEGEPKPNGFENMGFARADRVRELFAQDVPADRVRLKARLVDETAGVREGFFEGVLFRWESPEATVAETLEELDDRINIRFPYNSTEGELDKAVDDYLRRLAERVKETGERIMLTGHADNTGSADYNMTLGRRRAEQIQTVLIRHGVPRAQISVDSKGDTQPGASNATEEGRHENRRVEVRLIKN
jgi:outer membrane protein OmpA-like peptidoglycan-associated protein